MGKKLLDLFRSVTGWYDCVHCGRVQSPHECIYAGGRGHKK